MEGSPVCEGRPENPAIANITRRATWLETFRTAPVQCHVPPGSRGMESPGGGMAGGGESHQQRARGRSQTTGGDNYVTSRPMTFP